MVGFPLIGRQDRVVSRSRMLNTKTIVHTTTFAFQLYRDIIMNTSKVLYHTIHTMGFGRVKDHDEVGDRPEDLLLPPKDGVLLPQLLDELLLPFAAELGRLAVGRLVLVNDAVARRLVQCPIGLAREGKLLSYLAT